MLYIVRHKNNYKLDDDDDHLFCQKKKKRKKTKNRTYIKTSIPVIIRPSKTVRLRADDQPVTHMYTSIETAFQLKIILNLNF